MKFNEEKLAKLKRADEHFDECYGKSGTPERNEFEAKAKAWYYAEILREARKKGKITQKELAERIGKKREYIAWEQGKNRHAIIHFPSYFRSFGLKFHSCIDQLFLIRYFPKIFRTFL